MTQRAAARTTSPTFRPSAVASVLVIAAFIGTLAYQSASAPAPAFSEAQSRGAPSDVPQSASLSTAPFGDVVPGAHGGAIPQDDHAVSKTDGALPDGVTPFDDEYPGVDNLDPDLLRALREAAVDATDDRVNLFVSSGWRSPEYQDQLLREAISKYGSEKEAARWVATADTSPHVSGEAVDIGPFNATAWLSEHGDRYGLCQIYRNESWHFELRPRAIHGGCPRMFADPTRDPRLHQ